jgi:glycerol-3-phosphate acyltransferase PlsY
LFFILLKGPSPYVWVSAVMALLAIFRHRSNIANLIKGSEGRIGEH